MSYWTGPPGRCLRVVAVGDELAIGVEDRVRTKACSQDIGRCLGDFVELGAKVEVLRDQSLDGHVERQATRRAFLLGLGADGERAVNRDFGERDTRRNGDPSGGGHAEPRPRSGDLRGDARDRGAGSAAEDSPDVGRGTSARASRSGQATEAGRIGHSGRVGGLDRRALGLCPAGHEGESDGADTAHQRNSGIMAGLPSWLPSAHRVILPMAVGPLLGHTYREYRTMRSSYLGRVSIRRWIRRSMGHPSGVGGAGSRWP